MNIIKKDIMNTGDVLDMLKLYKRHRPKIVAYDTESDGLNIKHNKPFLISFGYITNDFENIYSYTLDYELRNRQLVIDCMYAFDYMLEKTEKIIGHNITFDLHMQDNIGYPVNYPEKYSDTQIYIRLAHDALKPDEGGPPLDLKGYATRYIDKRARDFEKELKREIKDKRREATSKLKERLYDMEVPEEYKVSGKEKHWTKAMIDDFFKDALNEIDDLPPEIAEVVHQWLKDTPDPNNYRNLDRENVTRYAHMDVVYTLLIWHKLHPLIKERKQEVTLRREERLIHSLYVLEKTGVYYDLDYAMKAKKKTKEYIQSLRKRFKESIGADITVNQHAKIKEVMFEKHMVNMQSSDANVLKQALDKNIPDYVKEIFRIILELRSLEKWYPTYLIGWIEEAKKDKNHMIYPTFKATGTVTGRVSSAFQQFPKKALYTIDGDELFHPREMFIAPKDYDIFYFDYAAMEMRLLATYTMLVAGGDLNLCRVFVPFKCHLNNGKWHLDEEPEKEWEPVDPHGLTAKNAFVLNGDEEDFKYYRTLGKRANFAVIYGATGNTISASIGIPKSDGQRLYRAFYKSFPKVNDYVSYVHQHIQTYGYAENLFGRKYYGINTHLARNYLIQGTGADYTKELLPQLVKLLDGKKSKIQGYLHDEFSFLIHKDERYLVPKIKEIMEQIDTELGLPVDVEYAPKDWRHKYDWTDV